MTERDFIYWLRGYFEISNATTLDEAATAQIKQHLNKLFEPTVTWTTYTNTESPSSPTANGNVFIC